MQFSWENKKRLVGLGPMDGVSDSPMRQLSREFGADFVFTEMISADGLVRKSKTILKKLQFKKRERPIIAQIFGKNPQIMAQAAQILEKDFKFDGIDVNAACPAKKMLNSGHGGSLLKDPGALCSLLDVVRRSTKLSLSLKTRLGYAHNDELIKIIPRIEKTGINAIIVHNRTILQKFEKSADKSIVSRLKKKISLPLIASGDVFTKSDIAKYISYGADGVLVARGALGNPWIFEGLDIVKEKPQKFLDNYQNKNLIEIISRDELKETILKHLNLTIDFYGDESLACVLFRKHFLWYLSKMKGVKQLKIKAAVVKSKNDVENILNKLLND